MSDKKVYIMRGQSGSGKSTYAAKRFPTAAVCSADNYWIQPDGSYQWDGRRVGESHGWCMRNFIIACQANAPLIVVDNTNTTIAEMAPYVAIGNAYGYEVEIINIVTPLDVATKRNVHAVPAESVARQYQNMQRANADIPRHWKMSSIVNAEPVKGTGKAVA